VSALEELVEEGEEEEEEEERLGVVEVLPALRTLFLEESFPPSYSRQSIERFATARQLANQPISISGWKRNGF
jgi:hypothetical protein